MISTNVGTAFCWAEAAFGFTVFGGLFETDFGDDFNGFVDFVPDGFTGSLAGVFAIGRTDFEIGRIGFCGGLVGFMGGRIGFVGGDLVDFCDFVGPVGVVALWRATPVFAPWLWFRSRNLTEPPSIFVRHFAVQL